MQRISSRQNAVVARYRDAARGVDRSEMLLDGPHLLAEALDAGTHLRHVLVAAPEVRSPELTRLVDTLYANGVDVAEATAPVLDAASPVRSASPVVALAERPTNPRSPFEPSPALVVVACDIQDPGNLGAIIRVAEAAGATGLIVAGQSADPFGWKALRGSMGSALRLPLAHAATVEEACADAVAHGVQVAATVPRRGALLNDAVLSGPVALLIGGEGPGLPRAVIDAADQRITIPMESPVESLNAAVAAAVLLYEARRQRHAAPSPVASIPLTA